MGKNILNSVEAKLYLVAAVAVLVMILFAIVYGIIFPTPTSVQAPLPHSESSTTSDSL